MSPEQISKWRKDAERPYHEEYGIHNDAITKFAYTLGYIRARTEQATPITSAEITPAMYQEWNKIFAAEDTSFVSPKEGEIMAAAVNAYLGSKK